MTTLEILKAARVRIANPNQWLQKIGCVDSSGKICPTNQASRFCAGIAIQAKNTEDENLALQALGFTSWREIYDWNDAPERTHAEVLVRFDEAIAKLEEKVC